MITVIYSAILSILLSQFFHGETQVADKESCLDFVQKMTHSYDGKELKYSAVFAPNHTLNGFAKTTNDGKWRIVNSRQSWEIKTPSGPETTNVFIAYYFSPNVACRAQHSIIPKGNGDTSSEWQLQAKIKSKSFISSFTYGGPDLFFGVHPSNNILLFDLLSSPEGSWSNQDGHTVFLIDQSGFGETKIVFSDGVLSRIEISKKEGQADGTQKAEYNYNTSYYNFVFGGTGSDLISFKTTVTYGESKNSSSFQITEEKTSASKVSKKIKFLGEKAPPNGKEVLVWDDPNVRYEFHNGKIYKVLDDGALLDLSGHEMTPRSTYVWYAIGSLLLALAGTSGVIFWRRQKRSQK